MKKIVKIVSLCLLTITFLSCKDENVEIMNELGGQWEIESISVLQDGEWEIVTNQDSNLGILYFDNCHNRNQNCSGYRKLADGNEIKFEFYISGADKEYNPTTISMSFLPNDDSTAKWQGVYDIVTLSSQLTLERTEDDLIVKAKRL